MKIHIFFYPLLLFSWVSLVSQPANSDSLLVALKSSRTDSGKVNMFLALAEAYLNNQPHKSTYYCQQALQLSEKSGYKPGFAKASVQTGVALIRLGNFEDALGYLSRGQVESQSNKDLAGTARATMYIGMVYSNRGNYPQASACFFLALETSKKIKPVNASDHTGTKLVAECYSQIGIIQEKQGSYDASMANQKIALHFREESGDQAGIAHSYNCIGMLYRDKSNYTEAMKNQLTALKIQEEIKDQNGLAFTYRNAGIIHILQSNFEAAIQNLQKSLALYTSLGNKKGIADALTNIGWYYSEMGNWQDGLKNFQEALRLCTEIGDKQNLALLYNNTGFVMKHLGHFDEAMKNLFLAAAITREIGDKLYNAEVYESIGETYASNGNYQEGLLWIRKAIVLSTELGAKRITKECYAALARIYEKLNDYRNAFKYQNLYAEIKESIDDESSREVSALISNYETDKQHALAKAEQDKKDALAESELKNERSQKRWIILSSMVLLSGLITLGFLTAAISRNLRKNRKLTQELNTTMVDLKSAQNQLVQNERMAAFGIMATRMAHEIQNPLNFVNNFSELSQDLVKEIGKPGNEADKSSALNSLMQNLQKIHHHGKRASEIIIHLQEQTRAGKAPEYFEKS